MRIQHLQFGHFVMAQDVLQTTFYNILILHRVVDICGLLCELLLEGVSRFEVRDIVGRNNEYCVLTDVAGGLLGALLHGEGAEATEIHVLAICETVLNGGHKLFNNCEYSCLF